MNKKLFKGALVLFASILMAVSCSNNNTDPNKKEEGDGTTKVEITTVEASALQNVLKALKSAVAVQAADSSSTITFDFSSVGAPTSDNKGKFTLAAAVEGAAGGDVSAATTISAAKILEKVEAEFKKTSAGEAGKVLADSNIELMGTKAITVTPAAGATPKTATLTILFKDTTGKKGQGSLIVTLGLASGNNAQKNVSFVK